MRRKEEWGGGPTKDKMFYFMALIYRVFGITVAVVIDPVMR